MVVLAISELVELSMRELFNIKNGMEEQLMLVRVLAEQSMEHG